MQRFERDDAMRRVDRESGGLGRGGAGGDQHRGDQQGLEHDWFFHEG